MPSRRRAYLRVGTAAAFLAGLLGCGLVEPRSATAIDGEYVLQSCAYMSTAMHGTPCGLAGSASGNTVADSSRLRFHNDRTVRWIVGTTRNSNPCYLSGPADCWTTTVGVDTLDGTYAIDADSIVVTLARTVFFDDRLALRTSDICSGVCRSKGSPALVTTAPDSLLVVLPNAPQFEKWSLHR